MNTQPNLSTFRTMDTGNALYGLYQDLSTGESPLSDLATVDEIEIKQGKRHLNKNEREAVHRPAKDGAKTMDSVCLNGINW